jgi:predicted house-cleaning noncanonical NTP pyrophosphatase (MazG superfamily)
MGKCIDCFHYDACMYADREGNVYDCEYNDICELFMSNSVGNILTKEKEPNKLPKLVRDKIPDIIRASGKECEIEILSREDYIKALDAKLVEEVAEYHESHSLEELADILECVYASALAISGFKQSCIDDLHAAYWKKSAERGGFWKRILLKEIKEKKE